MVTDRIASPDQPDRVAERTTILGCERERLGAGAPKACFFGIRRGRYHLHAPAPVASKRQPHRSLTHGYPGSLQPKGYFYLASRMSGSLLRRWSGPLDRAVKIGRMPGPPVLIVTRGHCQHLDGQRGVQPRNSRKPGRRLVAPEQQQGGRQEQGCAAAHCVPRLSALYTPVSMRGGTDGSVSATTNAGTAWR